jgi:hypothetical protein
MVTISITAEAFEAIKATLSAGMEADMRPDGKGGFHITCRMTFSTSSRRCVALARATATLL